MTRAIGRSGWAVAVALMLPGLVLDRSPDRLEAAEASEPYTCPMSEHADVRSDKPGKCPKCGMKLVPLSQTEHPGTLPSTPLPAGTGAPPGSPVPPASPPPAGMPGMTSPSSGASPPVAPVQKSKGPVRYHCPMHPNYVSDRPGDCPICNMTLVPMKEDGSAASGVAGYATLTIQPERLQRIGVQTALVERKKAAKTVRAAGKVERNETTLSVVNLKVGGWIEELHVKSVGESVRKGDPLFSLYSPDLLEAQKNYLLARGSLAKPGPASPDSRAFAEESLRSAKERLLLWDVTEEQIRAIEEKNEPLARVPILSRIAGVVTRRNVVQGAYAEPGRDLFEIADLSTVWILADVYEHEISDVKVGQEAKVHLSSAPEDLLSGKVAFVYPTLNEATRTLRARLEVPNTEGKLKPGMYAAVSLAVDLGEQIVIDDQAVLDSGTRQIVFVDRGGGRLEPRSVTLGTRADGFAVVQSGLKEGERVVTSGNFLIDSESRLKAALLGASPGGGSGGEHSGHAK